MKEENIILGGLLISTAIGIILNIKMRIDGSYEKGRADQIKEDTELIEMMNAKLEKCLKQIKDES